MAFYDLEPFGDVVADLRAGSVAAVIANVNRNAEKREQPFTADDFIFWRDTGARPAEDEPVLLEDPVAQSNLLRAALFGKASG